VRKPRQRTPGVLYANRPPATTFSLPIADCRLTIEEGCGELLRCQSAIVNRKSAILAILTKATIAEILRKKRRST